MLCVMTAVNPQRTRTPRSEVRGRVLEAAMSEFAAKGFVGTTIDAIAEVAGFTKGAVYSNFGSKDELFLALLDQQVSHRLDIVTDLVKAAAKRPSMTEVGDLLMREILANRDWQMLFLEYWLRAMRDAELLQRFVEHRRTLRQMIEDAVARLDIDENLDPKSTAVLLLALNNGLSIEELADPGSVPRDLFGSVLRASVT